jgi:hypothetical protein
MEDSGTLERCALKLFAIAILVIVKEGGDATRSA